MKFVKAKMCHIPGFMSDSINVLTEEATSDEVIKSFALSRVWGGNYDIGNLTIRIKKMKEKDFLENKTAIPQKFYTLEKDKLSYN